MKSLNTHIDFEKTLFKVKELMTSYKKACDLFLNFSQPFLNFKKVMFDILSCVRIPALPKRWELPHTVNIPKIHALTTTVNMVLDTRKGNNKGIQKYVRTGSLCVDVRFGLGNGIQGYLS